MASFGKEVEDKLEPLGAFIIWIGDMVPRCGWIEIFGHGVDFLLSFRGGRYPAQICYIGSVHPYDEVEIVEVVSRYLPASVGQLYAPSAGVDAHTVVRKLSYMVASRAC